MATPDKKDPPKKRPEKTFREFLNGRFASMKQERTSWEPHYRDLSDNIVPRRGRFMLSDTNKGGSKNDKIIDNTPTLASRILSSGMMAGITSPARPWFRVMFPDDDLMEYGPVKSWCEIVEQRINTVFARSNLYNSLPMLYEELGVFGTGAMFLEEDFLDVVRTQVFTVGEYWIAQDERLQVNTFARDFQATVLQLVSWFGYYECSEPVRAAYDMGQYDKKFDCRHIIDPNDGRYDLGFGNDRDFRGIYYEVSGDAEKMLEARGFHEFPMMCPRWHTTGMDIYGRSPGMDSLGDCKQLQSMHKRKLEGLDKWVRPPMKGSAGLKSQKTSILPGDITYMGQDNQNQIFEPIMTVEPNIQYISLEIQEVQKRIREAFFADIFLTVTNIDRRQITAREIDVRQEEKLLMLGPVLERLNDELLDPMVKRTFNIMERNGILPPKPRELEDMDYKIEYISIMAQAQKAVNTGGIDRLFAFAGNFAQAFPEIGDKIDAMEAVDKYGNFLGVPASIIRSDDAVQERQNARAEAAQQQAAVEQAAIAAGAAKTLGDTSVEDGTLLNAITGL